MKASKDEYLNRAFVMTEEDLVKLGEVIEKFASIRTVRLSCVDRVDREVPSVTDLLNFENPPHKAIKSIRFLTSPKGGDITTLWLRLDTDAFRNIGYSIEGKESAVVEFKDLLDERLSAMRPWYWIVADTGFQGGILVWLLTWFVNTIVAVKVISYLISQKILPGEVPSGLLSGSAIAIYIFFTLIISLVVTRIRAKTFPNGVFALGQGKRRHANSDVWRVGLGLGVAASIAASILLLWW